MQVRAGGVLDTQQRRALLVRRLLGQGLSVTQAAERLGYANPYHFSRTFKAVMGSTPSSVRAEVEGLHARWEGEPDE